MTGQTEAGTTEALAAAKPRRGKWTEQQQRRIVADSRVSGASIQEVARRHGVRADLLSAWRRNAVYCVVCRPLWARTSSYNEVTARAAWRSVEPEFLIPD